MRTITDQDSALLNNNAGAYRVWLKVEIDQSAFADANALWGSEDWVDLTNSYGYDWVLGVDYGESIDTPAWSASIRLLRQIGDNPEFSLSPFVTNSLFNATETLISPYRKVRISTKTVPIDDPKPSTFNVVFVGRIDNYNMAGNEIQLTCRDRTGELLDFICLYERSYGDDTPTSPSTPVLMEDIVQNILDDHYNAVLPGSVGTISDPRSSTIGSRTTDGSPWQLYSPNGTAAQPWSNSSPDDGSAWAMRKFENTKSTVWEWISQIVTQRGWQLRVRYHEGSGIDDFVLVAEEPTRSPGSTDYTLNPNGGAVAIKSVSLSHANIRNAVRVGYSLNGGESTSTTIATDTTSQQQYGYRFMEIREASSSQIDTANEADNFRDDLLSDTKDPLARVALECPYLWFVQLNDYVGLTADGFYFDNDQELAVLSRRNVIQAGGRAMTTLVLEGKPKAGVKRHVENQRLFMSTRNSPNFVQSSINYGGLVSNANFGTNPGE